MEQVPTGQCVFVVQTVCKQNEIPTATVRVLRGILVQNAAQNESSVRRLITKFEVTGSVTNIKKQNVDAWLGLMNDRVNASSTKLICRRSQQLNLFSTSLLQVLSKDLHMHAYNVQLEQEVKPNDGRRQQLADRILARQAGD